MFHSTHATGIGDDMSPPFSIPTNAWKDRLVAELKRLGRGDPNRRDYALVLAQMAQLVTSGYGPDDSKPKSGAGARTGSFSSHYYC